VHHRLASGVHLVLYPFPKALETYTDPGVHPEMWSSDCSWSCWPNSLKPPKRMASEGLFASSGPWCLQRGVNRTPCAMCVRIWYEWNRMWRFPTAATRYTLAYTERPGKHGARLGHGQDYRLSIDGKAESRRNRPPAEGRGPQRVGWFLIVTFLPHTFANATGRTKSLQRSPRRV